MMAAATVLVVVGLSAMFLWLMLDAVPERGGRLVLAGAAVTATGLTAWCCWFGWPVGPPEPVAGVYDPTPSRFGSIDRHWGLAQPSYWARDGKQVACAACPGSPLVLCWQPRALQMNEQLALAACQRGRWEP